MVKNIVIIVLVIICIICCILGYCIGQWTKKSYYNSYTEIKESFDRTKTENTKFRNELERMENLEYELSKNQRRYDDLYRKYETDTKELAEGNNDALKLIEEIERLLDY